MHVQASSFPERREAGSGGLETSMAQEQAAESEQMTASFEP
jgi:hypothetical protein